MKAAIALVMLSGCYLELGLGFGRTVGQRIDGHTEWVFTVGAGADFSSPSHRFLQGGSVEWTGGGNVSPEATGFTLGTDVRIAGEDDSQTRLSARLTPATLSWVDVPDGSERGYVVPVYLGISKVFACNARMQCAHVGAGVDSLVFHRDDTGYGAFIGPQFRISTTTGFLAHLRSSTGSVP